MIVRPKPGALDVLLAVRGSIMPQIVVRILTIALIAAGAVLVGEWRPQALAQVSAIPFTLLGLSLSIFMGFRNNACYDRWWEGRKLWGQMVIDVRSFIRQTADLPPGRAEPLLRGLSGFIHGLAARLRDGDEQAAIAPWFSQPVAANSINPSDAALRQVGRDCFALVREGLISDIHHSLLEARLASFAAVQGGCERIKTTPLPFAYSLLLHRTAYLFCVLLPFALADNLGWWTLPVVVIVSYTFFGLDALGDQLEDPFGADKNDLPLDALTRMLERELLEAAGATELPPPLLPKNFVLH